VPLFQNESVVQNLSYQNGIEFGLHENEPVGGKKFSEEWFHRRTRFKLEKGKSEMAYYCKDAEFKTISAVAKFLKSIL